MGYPKSFPPVPRILSVLAVSGAALLPGAGAFAEAPPVYLLEWGGHGSAPGQFDFPNGIALDGDGHVYVTDILNDRVQKFTEGGTFVRAWGSHCEIRHPEDTGCVDPDGEGPLSLGDGQFYDPTGIVFHPKGHLYVNDGDGYRVQKFDRDGAFLLSFAHGETWFPIAIGVEPGGAIYVGEKFGFRLLEYSEDGVLAATIPTQSELIADIEVTQNGTIYIAAPWEHEVQTYDSSGTLLGTLTGAGAVVLEGPSGLALDGVGNLYVADWQQDLVLKVSPEGEYLTSWGETGSGPGQFDGLADIEVGSDGSVYVVDVGNHRVQKFGDTVPIQPISWGGLKSRFQE